MEASNILTILATPVLALLSVVTVNGQGTVTLDYPWVASGIGYYTTYYDQSGMSFSVNEPYPGADMARAGAVLTGHPSDGTPHLEFVNTLGPSHFVELSLTNGSPFGVTAVDLADPVAPSMVPVSITFNGFKTDGSMVSQTFSVGGGESTTFQTFRFSPDLGYGLARVEIPSSRWAMDNLVFTIPEPGSGSLVFLGVLAVAVRRFGNTARCHAD